MFRYFTLWNVNVSFWMPIFHTKETRRLTFLYHPVWQWWLKSCALLSPLFGVHMYFYWNLILFCSAVYWYQTLGPRKLRTCITYKLAYNLWSWSKSVLPRSWDDRMGDLSPPFPFPPFFPLPGSPFPPAFPFLPPAFPFLPPLPSPPLPSSCPPSPLSRTR